MLPKKSALTSYSYRLSHDHQQRFLAALGKQMIGAGLAAASEAIFDLDFHAVMHWGRDPVLEKHYVPKRSQRAHSVLTSFAQDSGAHNLVYANADLSKATQAREVLAFCGHWKQISGTDPAMLVMDQKVTTQASAQCSWTRLLCPIVWSPSRHAGTILGANMAYEYDWTIRGSQPRNEEDRRKRKIFLGYLDALLEPVDMKSRFATSFWPHDLLPGDQRPPEGAGIEAMEQFRERISACTTVRSATATWIEDGAALSMLAGGADPGDLVGASMVVTYVHDRGPLMLPGSGRVYEPTGKALVVNVSDAVRIDRDGMITDRWSGLSFAHLHWQLEQNATP